MGVSIPLKSEKAMQSNSLAEQVRKESPLSYFVVCRLDFKLFSLHLQCSGHVQSINGVE